VFENRHGSFRKSRMKRSYRCQFKRT
jgi:hypothetical protein